MGEDWLTQALTNRWAVAALAYLLGVATGGLVLRVVRSGEIGDKADRRGDLNHAEDDKAGAGRGEKSAAAPLAKLSALEAEIRQAQSMLEADAQEHAAMTETLNELDEAVKRANGRLKLIVKSVESGG